MGIRRRRLEFEKNFTQIPNDYLRDKALSRRARGLLAELMTHEDGWHVSMSSLVASGPEGKDALRVAIGELERAGYLVRTQTRASGRFNEIEYEMQEPDSVLHHEAKPANGGIAANGKTAAGKSALKNTIPTEDQSEEPPLFCDRHPNGGTKCGDCGDARRVHSKWLRNRNQLPTIPRVTRPQVCEHEYPPAECPYCTAEEATA